MRPCEELWARRRAAEAQLVNLFESDEQATAWLYEEFEPAFPQYSRDTREYYEAAIRAAPRSGGGQGYPATADEWMVATWAADRPAEE